MLEAYAIIDYTYTLEILTSTQAGLYIAAIAEPEANTGYSRRELLTRYWQTPISREQHEKRNVL